MTVYVIRRGDYFLQGKNGWGSLDTADVFDDRRTAEKLSSQIENTKVVAAIRS